MSYPVLDVLSQLIENLGQYPIVILQAPPGAGKSTVLPLELLHAAYLNHNKIILLEPRRRAARSGAARMASLLNEEVGQTIGVALGVLMQTLLELNESRIRLLIDRRHYFVAHVHLQERIGDRINHLIVNAVELDHRIETLILQTLGDLVAHSLQPTVDDELHAVKLCK